MLVCRSCSSGSYDGLFLIAKALTLLGYPNTTNNIESYAEGLIHFQSEVVVIINETIGVF